MKSFTSFRCFFFFVVFSRFLTYPTPWQLSIHSFNRLKHLSEHLRFSRYGLHGSVIEGGRSYVKTFAQYLWLFKNNNNNSQLWLRSIYNINKQQNNCFVSKVVKKTYYCCCLNVCLSICS